jgi:hypothetical protein
MKRATFELTKDNKTRTETRDYGDEIGQRDLNFMIGVASEVYERQGYTVKVSVVSVDNERVDG